ncbi:hypothetical protein [Alkalilimnicola sp. S0819]|uniref:hypothetical protein n=1 Tax=Alkalilimnicola sp. S0819 TaxID=2613922 RepID=UPI0012614CFA|nr:hypothetical protein [Alkalilimnicola sp. S0819]KAB7627636.1 hypothetical protein F3N43_04050 [Alkalilimnicola sp. S0819]MPQ15801.1 hypothetical protein [Alkalilimnicola sp. S0819]
MKKNMPRLLLAALLLAAGPLMADTLKMDQRSGAANIDPPRGMLMSEVQRHYGAPESRRAPVGEPPITRWVYADSVVYFEHQRVLHSVKRR